MLPVLAAMQEGQEVDQGGELETSLCPAHSLPTPPTPTPAGSPPASLHLMMHTLGRMRWLNLTMQQSLLILLKA